MFLFGLFRKQTNVDQTASIKENLSVEQDPKSEIVTDQPYLRKIGKTHRVTGVSHYKDNILKLARKNPDYSLKKADLIAKGLVDTDIHKYLFPYDTAELVQEPDNESDPHAIQVVVGGQLVGYIKSGSCAQVNKQIREDRIEKVLCRISGGPRVWIYNGINDDTGKEKLIYEKDNSDQYRVELRIVLKEH